MTGAVSITSQDGSAAIGGGGGEDVVAEVTAGASALHSDHRFSGVAAEAAEEDDVLAEAEDGASYSSAAKSATWNH